MFVYRMTFPNGKHYIGQTTGSVKTRMSEHKYVAKKGQNKVVLYNAIRKYGFDSIVVDTIGYYPNQMILNGEEKYWIDFYNTNDRSFGYNTATEVTGHRHSEETIAKILETKKKNIAANPNYVHPLKGKPKTEEHKANQSAACKGRPSPFKGKHHTEERKEIIREFHLGKTIPQEQIDRMNATKVANGTTGKGIPKSEEQKLKQSLTMKGRIPWNKGLKKNVPGQQ